ncbi:MAG: glycosyltransferase [Bacteroidaceae bacterium]|nr:glycosyltransferase [Bacteroidaceae bacterium]
MRLSILIPVYNQDCTKLVADLLDQCNKTDIDFEILVMDDGSTNRQTLQTNRKIANWEHCTLHEFGHNQGRSCIRNRLVKESTGEYLLMIDSDAIVERKDFIQNYLDCLQPNTVICGGILHPENLKCANQRLRYMYEKKCESKFTAACRNQSPYQNLRTFNMLIPRRVALAHPFNENIQNYGYEDTLIGKELEQDNIQVLHIDNPLINGDIEDSHIFLKKTEESLRTLKQHESEIRGYSSLIQVYDKLRSLHLVWFVSLAYHLLNIPIRQLLLSRWPIFHVFQFYKLGYYCTL